MSDELATRGERTRSDILEAAYRLFVEKGYHGTSMRQIAQEAGIALGGIYNHFTSKDQVFERVLMERHPYLEIIPLLSQARGETADEILRDAARQLVDSLGQRTEFLNLMFIELVEFKGCHVPAVFQRALPDILAFGRQIEDHADELRSFHILMILRSFIGLFFSYVITDIMIANQLPSEMREKSLEAFLDIYLHGILKQGTPPGPEVK